MSTITYITEAQLKWVLKIAILDDFTKQLTIDEIGVIQFILNSGEYTTIIKSGYFARQLNSIAGKYREYKNQSV